MYHWTLRTFAGNPRPSAADRAQWRAWAHLPRCGCGLVFVRDVPRSTIVLRERPMVQATAVEGAGLWPLVCAVLLDAAALEFVLRFDESPAAAFIWDAMETQSAATVARYAGCTAEQAASVFKRVSTINFNSCIGYNGAVTKLVYRQLPYANHSCDPSCRIIEGRDGEKALVTLRDVAAGEDATFSYIGLAPRQGAQQLLRQGWGFDCTCAACCG